MLRTACVIAPFVLAVLVPTTAAAQTGSRPELAVAYSFLRILEGDGLNMPAGWLVSVAVPTTDWLSVVGEVAGNYKTIEDETGKLHSFQGGVRVTSQASPDLRLFGQFLLGAMNVSGGGSSDTEFSIEPGAGVDLPLNRRLSLRLAVGAPLVFADGETGNMFRFVAGFVF